MTLSRRQFFGSALPLVVAGSAANSAFAQAYGQPAAAVPAPAPVGNDKLVLLAGDRLPQSSAEGLAHLQQLAATMPQVGDNYLGGGAVTELEKKFSALLGKEDTVFMPTGTLANQVALRILCGEARHALVQQESHVYRDESNAVSTLSNINVVPLASGRAAPTVDEIREAIKRAEIGPYPIRVGAISLESPVRRASGATLPRALIGEIAALAKSKQIPMHLDGARLLLMCGIEGFTVKDYCAPFDTVYVSLYKYLNAGFGGVLSGSRAMMAKAREARHVFGGTTAQGWMAALPALAALDGAEQRFAAVRAAGERLLAGFEKLDGYKVQRVENASNIAFVEIPAKRLEGLQARLSAAGIRSRNPVDGKLELNFNESLLRRDAAYILAAFG